MVRPMSNASVMAAEFIKPFEACSLTAYHGKADKPGLWTIGWGHTGPEVHEGLVWAQKQADNQLVADLAGAEADARRYTDASVTDQQLAALISFVFNLGAGAYSNSTLRTLINQRDWLAAAKSWIQWDHSNGIEVKGLLIRRLEEAAFFLRGTP